MSMCAKRRETITLLIFLVLGGAALGARDSDPAEVHYPADDFSKLDTFEGLNIEDGDKLFAQKDYNGAYAEYKSYSQQFPKGKAVAYAVLRMGRCLHLTKKRNAAIRMYEEVVDFFPNDVRYAAAALYFQGVAHQENGDPQKCIAVWARMVKDRDYVKQPNSGTALIALSDAMDKAGEYEEATEYRWRIATEFRQSNPDAANQAKMAVRHHYTVRSPNHERFMEFYRAVGGFHSREAVAKDLDASENYWRIVFGSVAGQPDSEPKEAAEQRKQAASYWVGKFGSKFPKDDDLRRQFIDVQLVADGDRDAWVTRMLQQVEASPMSVDRLIRWLQVFANHPKAKEALLAKHATVIQGAGLEEIKRFMGLVDDTYRLQLFDTHIAKLIPGMPREEQVRMVEFLRSVNMRDQATMALRTIDTKNASDQELVGLAQLASRLLGEEAVLGYFSKMKDKKASLKATYDWYLARSFHRRGLNSSAAAKALELIDEVAKYPEWAEATKGTKASLLHGLRRYEDAIKAYQAWGKEPEATWHIVDCLIAMKNYDEAIKKVRSLESVGGKTAVAACMKAADIYKLAGNKGKEIEQLRLVLHRYPGSGESSSAHQRLESYGAKITGGQATVQASP
jgi:TolA-binding protein